ncbi:MAG: UDP-N-acetylmuramoyl-L-alanine--D-glutamate ligase [Pseudomonadota bacterium]
MIDANASIFALGPDFAGRRYAVLGLARSGLATVAALIAAGASVVAWDDKAEARDVAAALGAEITDLLSIDLSGLAGVVVSPGVPINRHPIAALARVANVPLIGDIELFAQARSHLPPHKVVGITGTNGKSTTTALIHHILKSAGVLTTMGGNIGLPILAQAALTPKEAGVGVYVLELSSYQIDLTHSLACDVAVLLNITPDHLDRYDGDFMAYAASKARLFTMQYANQVAVIATDDDRCRMIASHINHRLIRVSGTDILVPVPARWPALQGPHNAQNVAAAKAVCERLGLSAAQVEMGLSTYPGLPHRMERVGEIGGVQFVNDSKATNPASAAPALAAYPPAPRPRIHWILGGLAKGEGLGECEAWLGHVAHVYLIGDAAAMFARALGKRVPSSYSGTVEQAVADAATAAQNGDIVLLSPACASFDQFRDFEARGDAFRASVAALPGGER